MSSAWGRSQADAGPPPGRPGPGGSAELGLPAGMDAQELTLTLARVIKSSYANWADEPIPALGGQTPRQAMVSAAGLERVKGLLRSYEAGEAQQATQQGRREISYQFLWDALGLQR